jgi:hypothetical protein
MSEFKNPSRDMSRAILWSGLFCIAAYFLVPFVFQGVLGTPAMLAPGINSGAGVGAALASMLNASSAVTKLFIVLLFFTLVLAIMTAMSGSSRTLFLPPGPRRRVRGVRREEVAQLAAISPTYYALLEQRRDVHPSPQVLDAPAGALKLSPAERAHMHELASQSAATATPDRPETLAPAVAGLVDRLDPHPLRHRPMLGRARCQPRRSLAVDRLAGAPGIRPQHAGLDVRESRADRIRRMGDRSPRVTRAVPPRRRPTPRHVLDNSFLMR